MMSVGVSCDVQIACGGVCVTEWGFRYKSCFSGILGYPGLVEVAEPGSDVVK